VRGRASDGRKSAGQRRYLLTEMLTRLVRTGETSRDADDGHQVDEQVSETHRDAGDAQDARRTAHNPAMTTKPPASARAECVPKRPFLAVALQVKACSRAVCKAAPHVPRNRHYRMPADPQPADSPQQSLCGTLATAGVREEREPQFCAFEAMIAEVCVSAPIGGSGSLPNHASSLCAAARRWSSMYVSLVRRGNGAR
jgi:hypothetical protein